MKPQRSPVQQTANQASVSQDSPQQPRRDLELAEPDRSTNCKGSVKHSPEIEIRIEFSDEPVSNAESISLRKLVREAAALIEQRRRGKLAKRGMELL